MEGEEQTWSGFSPVRDAKDTLYGIQATETKSRTVSSRHCHQAGSATAEAGGHGKETGDTGGGE